MKLTSTEQLEVGGLYYLADSTGTVCAYTFENKAFDLRAILTGCAFTEPDEAELSLKRGRKAPTEWYLMTREQLVAAADESQKTTNGPDTRMRLLQEAEVKLREALAIMDLMPAPCQAFERDARRKLVESIDHIHSATTISV